MLFYLIYASTILYSTHKLTVIEYTISRPADRRHLCACFIFVSRKVCNWLRVMAFMVQVPNYLGTDTTFNHFEDAGITTNTLNVWRMHLNSTLKFDVGAKSIFALPRVLFKMTSCPNIIIKLSSGQLILCMKGSFAQLNRSCPTDRSFTFNGVLAVTETSRVNNFRIDKFVLKALTMLQFHKILYLNMIATSFAAVVIANIYT